MSDIKSPTDTIAAMGSDITQTMQTAYEQTKPVIGQMAERMNERLHDLAHQSQETTREAKLKIENQAKHMTTTAEHHIQNAPFKSIMIAAGAGLLTGVIATWLMRERSH
ncbi:hypothetical protein B9Z47_17560 [Limnohabitans sp. 2KL-1]|uniref:DUF883 family protein n=1 Tax=Limnohabitans sp. 2KL-1 TaxID=1100699 RepID=UPI000D336C60|nr:DUF883 family protein [Limnohabitans sp. 2KL-1]PUE44683.1 hypothetical protein B9Z47_17560 [Limnohabitans sp. 2KL-1]